MGPFPPAERTVGLLASSFHGVHHSSARRNSSVFKATLCSSLCWRQPVPPAEDTLISSLGILPVISILILSQSVISMIAVKGAVWAVWCDSNEAFLLPRCPTGLLSGVGPCYRSALAQPLL